MQVMDLASDEMTTKLKLLKSGSPTEQAEATDALLESVAHTVTIGLVLTDRSPSNVTRVRDRDCLESLAALVKTGKPSSGPEVRLKEAKAALDEAKFSKGDDEEVQRVHILGLEARVGLAEAEAAKEPERPMVRVAALETMWHISKLCCNKDTCQHRDLIATLLDDVSIRPPRRVEKKRSC